MIRECCSFDTVSYMCTPIKESKMNILCTNAYIAAYMYNDSEHQLVLNQHTQRFYCTSLNITIRIVTTSFPYPYRDVGEVRAHIMILT
jgi:hypothetical protein